MSGRSKRPRLLRPNKVSELIVDTDSVEARMSRDFSSVNGGSESMPGVSQPQPYSQTVMSPAVQFQPVPLMRDAADSGPDKQIQQLVTLQLTQPSCPHSSVVHIYTGGPRGKKGNEAS